MIQIEENPTSIPDVDWNITSSKEAAIVSIGLRNYILKLSSPCKLILEDDKPLMIAGIYRSTLTSPPFFWALFSRSFDHVSVSTVRAIKRISFPSCITYVEQGNEKAERLARSFGFRTEEGGVLFGDTMYDIYRRA